MNEFLLPLALIGATLIITRGTIFRPLQQLWPVFFTCPLCVGFWVGAAAGGSSFVSLGNGKIPDAFVVGCATSFLSMLANAVLIKLLDDYDDEP
jgi:hypothetical protein